ncbi:MAG: hypothetical protein AAF694_15200 [Bacteroidota bacterium]
MVSDILTIKDLFLAPILVFILYRITIWRRNSKYAHTPLAKYMVPALTVRIVGNFLAALMYQYYYGHGDTFAYYTGATGIWEAFLFNPSVGLEMIFGNPENFSLDARLFAHSHLYYSATSWPIRIGASIGLFFFNTYLCIAFIITFFVFISAFRMFRVFYELYPHLERYIAFSTLFIPSVFFWGTGLQKDSIALAALGFLTHSSYMAFIKKQKVVPSLFIIFACLYLLANIRPYVLIAFLPALAFWVFFSNRDRIASPILRFFAGPLLLGLGAFMSYFIFQYIGSQYQAFNLDNVAYTAKIVSDYNLAQSIEQGGSYYQLDFEPTLQGLISIFPQAVNVTLFRPYIWEIRKVILLPSVIESFLNLSITLILIVRIGPVKIFRYLVSEPTVTFCLIFAIIFAFAVGFGTANFGALARYKIPALPFYAVALSILWSKQRSFQEKNEPSFSYTPS